MPSQRPNPGAPLQNRVLATGEIVAIPARGAYMGNRGILHDDQQRLGRSRWQHKAWIICRLVWKDWHRQVMTPNAYTELFFWDEAVALAAGHRPCALCRRKAYNAYRESAGLTGTAAEMDAQLHKERAIPRQARQRRHNMNAADLPDGAIILDGLPQLIWGKNAYPIRGDGYAAAVARPTGNCQVLTPPISLAALNSGYKPKIVLE